MEINEDIEKTILKANGIIFKRIKKNCYEINFDIKNKNIYLKNIINFKILEFIFKLNNDFFEDVNLRVINEEQEANIYVLFKPLFEDFGISQKYSYLSIKKISENETIAFIITPETKNNIPDEIKNKIPKNAENLPLQYTKLICTFENPHTGNFTYQIFYNDEFVIPSFLEKMIGNILLKLFHKTKQFIENCIL
jgi:hypothetical protein